MRGKLLLIAALTGVALAAGSAIAWAAVDRSGSGSAPASPRATSRADEMHRGLDDADVDRMVKACVEAMENHMAGAGGTGAADHMKGGDMMDGEDAGDMMDGEDAGDMMDGDDAGDMHGGGMMGGGSGAGPAGSGMMGPGMMGGGLR